MNVGIAEKWKPRVNAKYLKPPELEIKVTFPDDDLKEVEGGKPTKIFVETMEPLAKFLGEADFLAGGGGEKVVVRVLPLKA